MILNIPKKKVQDLLCKQVSLFFNLAKNEKIVLIKAFSESLKRTEYCLEKTKNFSDKSHSKYKDKYNSLNGKTYFNPYHSGQYSIFLYFVSNTVFKLNPKKNINKTLADKVYYLNKALNGLDLFYEVEMPKIFILDHPVGAVLGRAKYGDYFSFSQGCTVGNNKGIFPKIGKNVKMFSNSKMLGKCKVGDNVTFAANSYIKDKNIPSNVIVFGQCPNNIIKKVKLFYTF